jgi:glycosyltransferase involved in cell wall biosynthesis
MGKTFIIIPAYNETEVIAESITPLLSLGYEVVVVDDGSKTNIESHIKNLKVHFLRHEINLGQGAALQTGMDYINKFNPEYVVHYDADGQHNYKDIVFFIEVLKNNNADIVLGSRFLKKETQALIPFGRQVILKIARLVNWLFAGLLLTDAHNGFRVMKGSVLNKMRLTENRMAHATEILRIINKEKLVYAEAPTEIHYTEYSLQKGQKPTASINILIDLILHRFI